MAEIELSLETQILIAPDLETLRARLAALVALGGEADHLPPEISPYVKDYATNPATIAFIAGPDRHPARADGQRLDHRHPGPGRGPPRRLHRRGHQPLHALVHGRARTATAWSSSPGAFYRDTAKERGRACLARPDLGASGASFAWSPLRTNPASKVAAEVSRGCTLATFRPGAVAAAGPRPRRHVRAPAHPRRSAPGCCRARPWPAPHPLR